MAIKICPDCKARVPVAGWTQHRQAHKNRRKTGPHWTPEGRRARRDALERDNYRCRVCGRTSVLLRALEIELHVHHLNGNRADNRLVNLESRCSDCHPRGGSGGR